MASFLAIAELFEIATKGMHFGAAPPTQNSLRVIHQELGLSVPETYVQIARMCPNYGAYLNGIGEDFDHGVHILRLNRVFRDCAIARLPSHLVLINHGEDGDCDCWDLTETTKHGEHPVVRIEIDDGWSETRIPPKLTGIKHPCFHNYLEQLALHYGRHFYGPHIDPKLKARAAELVAEISGNPSS